MTETITADKGTDREEMKPEQEATPSSEQGERQEWHYAETTHAAVVIAGGVELRPHWKGVVDAEEIRKVVRFAATAPALHSAITALLDAMEMQEGREREELHITQQTAWHVWTNAKIHARAALALVDGPQAKEAK